MKMFFPICVLLIVLQTGSTQSKIVFPRDETDQDPTLTTFVRDLKKAIASKDDRWILSVLDKDVVSTYGDEPGIEVFKNYWTPENDSTDFWPYLDRVVKMGGVFCAILQISRESINLFFLMRMMWTWEWRMTII